MRSGDLGFRVSLPRDSTGFVRRGCPVCSRHFKLKNLPIEDRALQGALLSSLAHANGDDAGPLPIRHCPYCAHSTTADLFLTPTHRHYVEGWAQWLAAQVRYEQLRLVERTLNLNPYVTFLTVTPNEAVPELPPEPDDLSAVLLSCCREELKIGFGWTEEIFCPFCRRRQVARSARRRIPFSRPR